MADETNGADEQITILNKQVHEYLGVIYTLTLVERDNGCDELRGWVPGLNLPGVRDYPGYDEPLDDEDEVNWPYYSGEGDDDAATAGVTIEDNITEETIWLVRSHCQTAIS